MNTDVVEPAPRLCRAEVVAELALALRVSGVVDVSLGASRIAEGLRGAAVSTRATQFVRPLDGTSAEVRLRGLMGEAPGGLQSGWGGSYLTACVDVLQRLLPAELPSALWGLREGASEWLLVAVRTRPSAEYNRWHGTVVPRRTWRALVAALGFELVDDPRCAVLATEAEPAGDWAIEHWARLDPFRDMGEPALFVMLARRREGAVSREAFERTARRLLGVRDLSPLPALIHQEAESIFLLGHMPDLSLLAPLWAGLSRERFRVLFRSGADRVISPERHGTLDAWLRARRIVFQSVSRVTDAEWSHGPSPRAFITASESSVSLSHQLNGAFVLEARARGYHTFLLQHGIWCEDTPLPVVFHSEHVLAWSPEHRESFAAVAPRRPTGEIRPRGLVEGNRFHITGCAKFDRYADPTPAPGPADLFGDWAARYERSVLLATNLHWPAHVEAGPRTRAALIDTARRMPETLFIIKLHPVENADAEILAAMPLNVVLLDEPAILHAGLETTRLVRAVDAVACTLSTVALEAVLAEKPVYVVDTNNPMRYEHVEPVPPPGLASRLSRAAMTPEMRAFRSYYYDTATLGLGRKNTWDAIAATLAGGPPAAMDVGFATARSYGVRMTMLQADIDEARAYQLRLEREIEAARRYQANLEAQAVRLEELQRTISTLQAQAGPAPLPTSKLNEAREHERALDAKLLGSRERLSYLEQELENLRRCSTGMREQWTRIPELEAELSHARQHTEAVGRHLAAAREQLTVIESEAARAQAAEAESRLPRVDILVVAYNSQRWLDGFFDGLRGLSYAGSRLRLIFVDNGSSDETVARARRALRQMPFETELIETGVNRGFTGGYGEAFAHARGDYYFVVNLDTVISPDALSRLVEIMEADPSIGIAEARQSPMEHPKYYDAVTRETSWCSGACMLVRSEAVRQVGGFDDLFFMYAEDVDLSWRMWLHGWRCVYVPEAVVQHFTEALDPHRTPALQTYFSMRNGALMRVMYGTPGEIVRHYAAMLRIVLLSRNPRWHRWLTFKAILTSLRRFRRAWHGRRERRERGPHPWVFFNGWLYGRHARDIAAASNGGEVVVDLIERFREARKHVAGGVPIEGHLLAHPGANVAGVAKQALLTYAGGEITYQLEIPADASLSGSIAALQETFSGGGAGEFEIRINGERLWSDAIDVERPEHRCWRMFEHPVERRWCGRKVDLTLRFQSVRGLAWGLWGEPTIRTRKQHRIPTTAEDAASCSTQPAVSIVIPTHNRAAGLPRMIARLKAQDIDAERFEVVLVDSRSSDPTPAVASRLADGHSNLRPLRCEAPGAAAARNMGIEAARAPLIVLLDDDILVAPDFVQQILAAHEEHPDRVLLGRILAPWEDAVDPFHRFLLQSQDVNVYDFPDPTDVPANYFYTACVAIPRSVLGTTRFDEGFRVYGVEDIEFGFRLLVGSTRMVFLPHVRVWHEYYPRYADYRRKKRKAGYSLGYFLHTHPQLADRFVFERRIRHFYHGVHIALLLTRPIAALLYFWEQIRYATGPLPRLLYQWISHDVRLSMYGGLRSFRRGEPAP